MKKRSSSSLRKKKPKNKFETEIWEYYNKEWAYEPERIKYVQPAVNRVYVPDFKTPKDIYVECKGYWKYDDRRKHLLIRQQYPTKRIVLIFYNSRSKITKNSKTTYGDRCDEHGLEWYCWRHKKPPKEL